MNINGYLDYINTPWGLLFYRLIWHNLEFENKKILDFGSGFGVTANHLAKYNAVTAVEPNSELLEHRICDNCYEQMIGSIDKLKEMDDNSFDVILCHNVLDKVLGIRTFFGIQPNSFKSEPDWEEKMFALECAVEGDTAFTNMAFFQHLLLKRK